MGAQIIDRLVRFSRGIARLPGGRVRAGILVTFGLLALGYLTVAVLAGAEVPRGTSVAGVDIGGMSARDAEAKLRAQLARPMSRPLRLTADGAPGVRGGGQGFHAYTRQCRSAIGRAGDGGCGKAGTVPARRGAGRSVRRA
jgi:hypothetical protein